MNLFFYSNDAEISNKVVANGEYIFFGDSIRKKIESFKQKKTRNCYDILMENFITRLPIHCNEMVRVKFQFEAS